MKVTIIGSGSAYGIPYAGGNWGDCDPANPKNRRTAASLLIENEGKTVLVDMSPDFREQSERHNIRALDAILFTHSHADHILGNFHLPLMMQYFPDRDLPCYADKATLEGIQKMWWFQHDPNIPVHYYGEGRPQWTTMEHYRPFEVAGLEILPFRQDHGHMDSVGFRIGDFVYSPDLVAIPEETKPYLKGIKTWIVECDSMNPSSSHSHLEQTLGWIEEFKPEKAILIHLDSTIDYETISQEVPANVELAYDGMVLENSDGRCL